MPGKSKEPSINGTGIGIRLSIVKDLVELHNGTRTVESTEGVGTTFSITIPVERAFYAENEIDLEKVGESVLLTQEFDNIDSEAQSINKPGRYSLPKILLVEDNKGLREYLTGFFERNFKVYSAVDELEGLRLAKEKIPDIIVADILMPNMNGYEFCNEIRNNFDTSHVPVLMLTSNSTKEQQLQGLSTGADAYITKPFSIDLLETTVNTIIENRKKLRSRLLGVGQVDESEKWLPYVN